jgi:hypothetical protein
MFMFFMATGQPSLSVSPVRVELVQPGVRNAHAMVYDSVRKRVVLSAAQMLRQCGATPGNGMDGGGD